MESLQATYRDDEEEEDEEPEQQQEQQQEEEDDGELITVPINETSISINYFQSTNNSDEVSDYESQQSDQTPPFPPLKKLKPISQQLSSKKQSSSKKKPKSKKGKKKNGNHNHPQTAHQVFDEMSVQISPIPKLHLLPDNKSTDDSPDMRICLSKLNKAEKVELSEDRLTAGSSKGYRMVRATRGVVKGAWYFEIKVEKLGETGHSRVGWSTEKGDLQAPVGYDGNSFGYRDVDGSKVHKATREMYGEGGYVEGDVIGCYISLPDGDLYAPKTPNWVLYKGQKYAAPANGKDDQSKVVPGSEISFFKNGVCQGVAFKDINGGCYYPAASMYTLPNQPNCQVKFNFGPDFDFFPNDFGDRPLPTPMFEVPYEAFDGTIENIESTEEKIQQNS